MDFVNWRKLCEEKDKRIEELEGKFVEIVERLESKIDNSYDPNWNAGIIASISVVESVGGMND